MYSCELSAWRARASATQCVAGRLRWNLALRRSYADGIAFGKQGDFDKIAGKKDRHEESEESAGGQPPAIRKVDFARVRKHKVASREPQSDRINGQLPGPYEQQNGSSKGLAPGNASGKSNTNDFRIRGLQGAPRRTGQKEQQARQNLLEKATAAVLQDGGSPIRELKSKHHSNPGSGVREAAERSLDGNVITPTRGPGKDGDTDASKPAKKKPRLKKPLNMHIGTVYTSRPQDISAEALLGAIETLRIIKPKDNNVPITLSILLTPGMARFAQDASFPLKLLSRFSIPGPQPSLDSIVAIVDKLPIDNDERSTAEGVAYCLQSNGAAFDTTTQRPLQATVSKPGSLIFEVLPDENSGRHWAWHLQLPLAQTIFSTGRISTLIHRHHELTHDAPESKLQLQREQFLETQTLRVPISVASFGGLSVPLIPLTPFRQIKHVMGNIIRQISPDKALYVDDQDMIRWNESDKTVPASEELESAVTNYFKVKKLDPEAVSIWALVVPATPSVLRINYSRHLLRMFELTDSSELEASWLGAHGTDYRKEADPTMKVAAAIPAAIKRGGRLIKVISGGGGWGKKAGLLSLDPDVSYSTRSLREDSGWQFNFDNFDDGTTSDETAVQNQKREALGSIVKDTDTIMFLIAPRHEHTRTYSEGKQTTYNNRFKKSFRQTVFGAIPSSIDAVSEIASSADSGPPDVTHVPGLFGMLSEGGMAATAFLAARPEMRIQTKVDVPYSRYTLTQSRNPEVANAKAVRSIARATSRNAQRREQSTADENTAALGTQHSSNDGQVTAMDYFAVTSRDPDEELDVDATPTPDAHQEQDAHAMPTSSPDSTGLGYSNNDK